MEPTVIIIGVAAFAVTLFVLSKLFSDKSASYKKRSLSDISRDTEGQAFDDLDVMTETNEDSFAKKTSGVPILGNIGDQLKFSGANISLFSYMLVLLVGMFLIAYFVAMAFRDNWLIGSIVGIVVGLALSNFYLGILREKRNKAFLDNFPDAIDMIVRSVRAGQPLLTALRTIAESGEPPLNYEFQKVVDEVSYGRPLNEALYRMTERVNLLDVNFFSVILSIQQETGGNLAEVLGNLSDVIRKRKQLRLKVRALTAEGRLTSTIFAAIPFLQLGAVFLIARDYLDPLFNTETGNIILLIAGSMIALAIFVSRKLSNVKV